MSGDCGTLKGKKTKACGLKLREGKEGFEIVTPKGEVLYKTDCSIDAEEKLISACRAARLPRGRKGR